MQRELRYAFLSGNRPASKTLRATMLSADMYRQLSAEDKKVWRQLSDVGEALFVKSMPTSAENAALQRSAMKHEVGDEDSEEDNLIRYLVEDVP